MEKPTRGSWTSDEKHVVLWYVFDLVFQDLKTIRNHIHISSHHITSLNFIEPYLYIVALALLLVDLLVLLVVVVVVVVVKAGLFDVRFFGCSDFNPWPLGPGLCKEAKAHRTERGHGNTVEAAKQK